MVAAYRSYGATTEPRSCRTRISDARSLCDSPCHPPRMCDYCEERDMVEHEDIRQPETVSEPLPAYLGMTTPRSRAPKRRPRFATTRHEPRDRLSTIAASVSKKAMISRRRSRVSNRRVIPFVDPVSCRCWGRLRRFDARAVDREPRPARRGSTAPPLGRPRALRTLHEVAAISAVGELTERWTEDCVRLRRC